MDHEMSEPERQLPGVTVPSFERVITGLFGAPGRSVQDARPAGIVVRFRADGLSMYPAIRDGELITVGPVDADRIVRGDVLLCRSATRLLAHRVVAIAGHGNERVLQLRGDAKGACDAPVAVGDVVGRVLSVSRKGRAIGLCGCAARLRYKAWSAASRAKAFVMSIAAIAFGARSKSAARAARTSATMFAFAQNGPLFRRRR
jgi:signal peptidase I